MPGPEMPDLEHKQRARFLVGCLILVGVFGCVGLVIFTPVSNLLIFFFGG